MRRDSSLNEATIVAEVKALMIDWYPEWARQERIERAWAASGGARMTH